LPEFRGLSIKNEIPAWAVARNLGDFDLPHPGCTGRGGEGKGQSGCVCCLVSNVNIN